MMPLRQRSNLPGILLGIVGLLLAANLGFAGPVVVNVRASIGPDPFNSPYFFDFASNAMTGLIRGQNTGTPGTPSYYGIINPEVVPTDRFITTSFPSWYGKANPETHFGPAFAQETGNYVYFSLHVQGNGSPIRLNDVSFSFNSNNPRITAAIAANGVIATDWAGEDYSDLRVGRSGNTFLTSGPGTTPVDELWLLGVAEALTPDALDLGPTPQATLDSFLSRLDRETTFTFEGTYTVPLGAAMNTGRSSLVFIGRPLADVPEPTSALVWCLGAGLTALCCHRRRRSCF